jgi:hypothetical protein
MVLRARGRSAFLKEHEHAEVNEGGRRWHAKDKGGKMWRDHSSSRKGARALLYDSHSTGSKYQ